MSVRGLWRWSENTDGEENWFARVEVRLGEWDDLSQADYETRSVEPTFWALPLKDSYMRGALSDIGGGSW